LHHDPVETKNMCSDATGPPDRSSILGLEIRGRSLDVCMACIYLSEYFSKTRMETWRERAGGRGIRQRTLPAVSTSFWSLPN
jgi:hypothetical protein